MNNEHGAPCPACGFEVFAVPSGHYAECPICAWVDDPVQLRYPASRGGANTVSLATFQARMLDELPLEVRTYDGYMRSEEWRPLHAEECVPHAPALNGERYMAAHALGPSRPYWISHQAQWHNPVLA